MSVKVNVDDAKARALLQERSADCLERVVRWSKACDCKSTASTCEIRCKGEYINGTWTMTATFYPMLSCDECGAPWKLEPPNAPGELPGAELK